MDTGLHALVALAKYHEIPADAEQLFHQYGQSGKLFSETEILQSAKALSLKAKTLKLNYRNLEKIPLPALAKASDGSFFIIARVRKTDNNSINSALENNDVLIHDLRESAPRVIAAEELQSFWSGEVIVITHRRELVEILQKNLTSHGSYCRWPSTENCFSRCL